MSKRKIMLVALTICMVAILAVGGTLAYFTSDEMENNVFTMGNVKIDLIENFEQESVLMPGTKNMNNVVKNVTVKNIGTEDAYVRVHIALPAAVVDQGMNSYNDMLHWNFNSADYATGKWSLQNEMTTGNGWTGNGTSNQWTYNTAIDGMEYTVWVVTYRTALKANETTDGAAMTQVYLDEHTQATVREDGVIVYTKGNMTYYCEDNNMSIKVWAEGVQAAGFDDAYTALKAGFGDPTTAANPFNNYGHAE